MEPTGIEKIETPEKQKSNLIALAYGLSALSLALIPLFFLVAGFDDGPRGRWGFADLKNWLGLARFCLGSLVVLAPLLYLAKLGQERAEHTFSALPAILAIFVAMLLIPGAVIQLIWWVAG